MFFGSKKMMFVLSPCLSLESNNYLCSRNWRLMVCKTKMVCMCELVCVCMYVCVCTCTHYHSDSVSYGELTLCTWSLRILGFPREFWHRYRKYHWDYSPCSEPGKKKKCAVDRNMIQGTWCGFPGSRTMIEPSQRPYHKVSEIFNELKLQPLGGKRKTELC